MVDSEISQEIKNSEIFNESVNKNSKIIEETEEEKESIKDFFDPNLDELKKAVNLNKVIKGVREVIRSIERKKVEKLYIALNDTIDGKYKEGLIKFASKNDNLTMEAKNGELDNTGKPKREIDPKKVFLVKDYRILRDVVMKEDLQFVNNLRGIQPKGPKCYCAAILIEAREIKKKSP